MSKLDSPYLQTPAMTQGAALTGIVKFFNVEKGYGFIGRDDGQDDVFAHITRVEDHALLVKGDRVAFSLAPSARNGKPMAISVRVIPAD
jgi:CspA family cold shock protein